MPKYLIRKNGLYYQPNNRGYTQSLAEAGRYTREEADRETHPNGPDGPRDGMTFVEAAAEMKAHAPELVAVATLLQTTGDAIANAIEQMGKGDWEDDHGHPVSKNIKMIELANTLQTLVEFRNQNPWTLDFNEPE